MEATLPASNFRFIRQVRGFLVLAVIFVAIGLVNLLQVASLLIFPFSKKRFRGFNTYIVGTWGRLISNLMRKVVGVKIIYTGENITQPENAFMIQNHQSMTDIVVFLPYAESIKQIYHLKWYTKNSFKYIPGPGWCLWFINCIFLKRDWTKDAQRVERTFATFTKDKIPFYLTCFAEGTRLTPEKLAKSQAFAKERGEPIPRHVLIPRTKGFVSTIKGLGGLIDAVHDITIGYPNFAPSIWQIACGETPEVHIHFNRYTLDQLPKDDEGLAQWLKERYKAKDDLLERFHKTGQLI